MTDNDPTNAYPELASEEEADVTLNDDKPLSVNSTD